MKSRRLALLVAIALGGGGFLSSAQSVSAADVTGNNVEIDSTHEPSNNAKDDNNTPFGTAAGFIRAESDHGNVTNNVLTFQDRNYTKFLFGGFTFGTGNATGNRVFIRQTSATPGSITDAVYGGVTDGGGSVEDNHVTFNGTRANGDLIGGMTTRKSYAKDGRGQGAAKENTATLEGGTVDTVYGGYTGEGSDGDVVGNTALVKGGVAMSDVYGGHAAQGGAAKNNIAKITNGTVNGTVYGGYASEKDVTGNRVTVSGGSVGSSVYGGKAGVGNATNNTVTIAGTGTVGQHVYGGGSTGGDAINNTVNLGDGTSNAVGTITGTIFGGRTSPAKDQTTGNMLNVKANAQAGNIENFSTINFDFSHVDTSRTLLKLVNAYNNKTKLQSLDQLHVKNAKVGGGTLIENEHGFELGNSTDVGRTEGQTETIIKKDMGGKKIIYRTYQFKNATEKDTDGLTTWGGRSLLGNTTTKNDVTLTGNHHTQSVYGGWTTKSSTITTEGSTEGHSIDNKITFNGGAATNTVQDMFGGLTAATGGNATGNRAVLNSGKVIGTLTGGSVGINGGSTTGNFVDINGGEVGGATYGGYTSSAGKAEKNEVTITNGTANNVYGGFSDYGSAEGNKVFVKGGTAQTVYGGKTAHNGNVTNNIVEVAGGTVNQSIYGGDASDGSGKAEGNTVTLTSGTAGGDIYGGLASSGDATKNTVNINGGDVNNHNVYGAWTTSGNATGNTVTIKGNGGTVKEIIGGRSNSGKATNNTVNLGDGKSDFTTGITGTISGGSGATYGNDYMTGNTLNVYDNVSASDIRNFAELNFHFNSFVTKTDSFLTLSNTSGTTIRSLNDINVHGAHAMKGTLIRNAHGVTVSDNKHRLVKTMSDTNKEFVLAKGTNEITYEGYSFAHQTTPTTAQNGADTDTWGGRSVGGNSTHDNEITVNSDSHTNVYGGWTSGEGTTAADKNNSYKNKVTVKGSATVSDKVYGGYTDVTGGTATGNTVTVEKDLNADLVGGKAAAEASDNTVNVTNATVKSVTGGDGATTNNNTVNLEGGVTVGGAVKGGTQTNGTGNTLNVKGMNTAQDIDGVQKLTFDAQGIAEGQTMLTLSSGGATKVYWNTLKASGMAVKKITLLKKTAGHINLDGYSGAAKSEITGGNTESNIDVEKNGSGDITDITYQGYQFKGTRGNATVDGTAAYGGRSKAGNTTTDNDVTVASGSHTNAYGGWTSGSGSKAEEKDRKDSVSNKVKIASTVTDITGTVYGGYTDVAGGNATSNEVTIEKSITGGVVGGKAAGDASGDASGNTVTVKANTGAVTGGDGATTNNNTVNLEGNVTVNGTVTGGTQANSTGNTLNVKGENSAQSVEGFQKMNFNTNGVAADGKMLNVTGGTQTKVNWNTLTVDGNGRNISLLKNNNGIDFGSTYTDGDVKSGLSEDKKSETNVSVTADKKEIKYTGYQFTDVTTASVDGTKAYGGVSKAGNATHHNAITVNTNYDEVYGGHTSGMSNTEVEKKDSHDNTVTITGGTLGKVYGGYTDAADGKTYNNTVNLGDGTNPLAPGTMVAEIYGGNKTATGNTLKVNTAATVGKIENFSTVAFKNAASKLTLTQAGANFDLDTIAADFGATENEVTLVENANGLTLKDNKRFRTKLSTDGTKETNIEARDDKKIVRYGYTIKGATTATSTSTEMWGGRSAAGNTTTGNRISVNDTGKTVYGGYTSGKGGTAADKNDSHTNIVTVTGGNMTVYGGWTNVATGKAVSNTVNVTANAQGTLVGGYSANGEASNNVVDVRNAVFTGNITGGQGTAANYNVIRLCNASVTGTITGGIAPNVKDNTLEVSYGTGTSSSVGDITNVQRLHFDMENAPVSNANPLLKLTNVSGGGDKNLTGMKFAVARSGATKKLEKGDTFTLMENTTAPGKKITVGSGVTAEGRDGVSRNYTFDISTDATGKLIATVTKAGMGEQSKSIVETRAGASAFLNDGADFKAGSGMDAAKKEARAAAQAGSTPYGLWAGMGGGALRHKTGSYVDMKGWNLGLGWARENAVQAGTLTFGPFVEYGRGSYDSYLDDGTHGSGKTSFFGAGMMAKLETGSHWIDGSLRVGRTKSDYTGLATYDTTSTYYGVQVGAGKDFHVNETDTVGAYVRYAYSHTAGTSAHLSSGETYDFDAVNSHRLRIGTRYTHGMADFAQFYAGLAWEYEFDGDARATSQGDSAPSPSLKGSSALLELGYRFAPQGSRMSYDLNLTGWQGKRQGITGGASVKWAF